MGTIMAILGSYTSARFQFRGTAPRDATWQPPQDTFIKINFDAAILDADWFQILAVSRDVARQWVGLSIRKLWGSPSPVVAEAYAAGLALQLAKTKGWTKVHLEGDCLQVINALNDKNGDRLYRLFSFGAVISACPELFSSFEAFICSFIRRVGNSLARSLAHISL